MLVLEIFVGSWYNSQKCIDTYLRFVKWVFSPSIVLQTHALSYMTLELASTDTPCQCTDLQGSMLFFPLSFTCCQGGQHEHNVSLFLCRPLSHALSVTGHRRRLRWVGLARPEPCTCWNKWPNSRGHVDIIFSLAQDLLTGFSHGFIFERKNEEELRKVWGSFTQQPAFYWTTVWRELRKTHLNLCVLYCQVKVGTFGFQHYEYKGNLNFCSLLWNRYLWLLLLVLLLLVWSVLPPWLALSKRSVSHQTLQSE